jgi:hypothetical protein
VSLAVYERRLPIYKAAIEFIRYVVRDLKPEYPQIRRAVRLHAVVKMREAAVTYNREVGNFEALVNEETSLAAWFTDQYDAARREFAPFLQLE